MYWLRVLDQVDVGPGLVMSVFLRDKGLWRFMWYVL